MELPLSLRETLVDNLDEFLDALPDNPSPESVAAYLIEQLEMWGEETGNDEVIGDLEDEAVLDGSLAEMLESEMESNEEFEWTGEEVVSLLDEVCAVDWDDDEDEDEDDDEDDDDDI